MVFELPKKIDSASCNCALVSRVCCLRTEYDSEPIHSLGEVTISASFVRCAFLVLEISCVGSYLRHARAAKSSLNLFFPRRLLFLNEINMSVQMIRSQVKLNTQFFVTFVFLVSSSS